MGNKGGEGEDPSLTWTLPASSPTCCLTVTLSGKAQEAHGHCAGVYKSTGLISMGRPVFKLEGSDDCCYLYVGQYRKSWSIWSSLKAEKVYIDSGSAGQACPAHPRNAPNLLKGTKEWKFNKADGNSPFC